ncbi:MAG: Uma2 family endonuclease [Vicinamibacterales bacterium]
MHTPAAHPDTRLTYDDFLLLPDDGKRHEIIDGAHFVTRSPNVRHQVLVRRLLYELEHYFRSHAAAGRVFTAPLDVVLSAHDVVEPDLLVIMQDQPDILTDTNIQGAPALVVEVFSKSTRKTDAQIKRRLYDRTGVREYWLVDPELDLVQVFRRAADGRLARVAELTAEDAHTLETPLLPECAIDLRELFRPM